VERAVEDARNSGLMAGVRQLAAQAVGQALGLGEFPVAGALETPGVDDDLAEDELLERAGGPQLAGQRAGESLAVDLQPSSPRSSEAP
jgi:hypothetical protein